jgi:hypothetical protein
MGQFKNPAQEDKMAPGVNNPLVADWRGICKTVSGIL